MRKRRTKKQTQELKEKVAKLKNLDCWEIAKMLKISPQLLSEYPDEADKPAF
jgi:hypothetical protein